MYSHNVLIFPGLDKKHKLKYMAVTTNNHHDISESIINRVCECFKISVGELKSPCRKRHLAMARSVAMSEIRSNTALTLAQIGKLFNRDHSSVIYAIDTHNDLIAFRDKTYTEMVERFNQYNSGL